MLDKWQRRRPAEKLASTWGGGKAALCRRLALSVSPHGSGGTRTPRAPGRQPCPEAQGLEQLGMGLKPHSPHRSGAQCRKQTGNSPWGPTHSHHLTPSIHGTWTPKCETHSLHKHYLSTCGARLGDPQGIWHKPTSPGSGGGGEALRQNTRPAQVDG